MSDLADVSPSGPRPSPERQMLPKPALVHARDRTDELQGWHTGSAITAATMDSSAFSSFASTSHPAQSAPNSTESTFSNFSLLWKRELLAGTGADPLAITPVQEEFYHSISMQGTPHGMAQHSPPALVGAAGRETVWGSNSYEQARSPSHAQYDGGEQLRLLKMEGGVWVSSEWEEVVARLTRQELLTLDADGNLNRTFGLGIGMTVFLNRTCCGALICDNLAHWSVTA